jgi:hypothetical protein
MGAELKKSYINALTSAANSAGGKDFMKQLNKDGIHDMLAKSKFLK